MKNAIITAATAVTGFAFGGLFGFFYTFRTYPRRYLRITGYGRKLPQKLTGGSFRETYEDNEPLNPVSECFSCNFYDSYLGCVVPSFNKPYDCPHESKGGDE